MYVALKPLLILTHGLTKATSFPCMCGVFSMSKNQNHYQRGVLRPETFKRRCFDQVNKLTATPSSVNY